MLTKTTKILHLIFWGSISFVVVVLLFLTPILSHWDFSHGKLGLLSLGKASLERVALLIAQYVVYAWFVSVILSHQTHDIDYTSTGTLTCVYTQKDLCLFSHL